MLKRFSMLPEFVRDLNELEDLLVNKLQGLECFIFSGIIAEEITLLHESDVRLEAFLVGSNLLGILLALSIDKRSDLFFYVSGKLFEGVPLVEELLGLLRLLVLADVIDCKELERLIELIEVQHCRVVLGVNNLHGVLDCNEGSHISEIFAFAGTAGLGLFHEGLHLLNFLLSVLHHSGAGKMVHVRGGGCVKTGSIW